MAARGALYCLLIAIGCITTNTYAFRYGMPSNTLHTKAHTEEEKLGRGMRIISMSDDVADLGGVNRKRRSANAPPSTKSESSDRGSPLDSVDTTHTTMVSSTFRATSLALPTLCFEKPE